MPIASPQPDHNPPLNGDSGSEGEDASRRTELLKADISERNCCGWLNPCERRRADISGIRRLKGLFPNVKVLLLLDAFGSVERLQTELQTLEDDETFDNEEEHNDDDEDEKEDEDDEDE